MSWPTVPNNLEVRRWAENLGLPIESTGRLPQGVIDRWNREHPDRPFIREERHHGTAMGYNQHRCRCRDCSWWMTKSGRERRQAQASDKKWQDDNALDLEGPAAWA